MSRLKTLQLGTMLLMAIASTSAGSTITLDANGAQDVQNLQQIALALNNYRSTYQSFPAQYVGPVGTPLLSWRVAILPFLGQTALYDQFDLSKAWNDPVNIGLLAQMPAVFRNPVAPIGSTNTDYAAGVDPNSIFPGSPGVKVTSITDGTSNTILVGESSGSAIAWTAPVDLPVGTCPTLGGSGFSSNVSGAVPFAFADGSVKFLPDSIGCAALRGLLLRNDGFGDTSIALDYVVAQAPEPSSLPLVGVILSGLTFVVSRNRRRTVLRSITNPE